MSTYVMSDIHGCYDDLRTMLEVIGFSASEAGDRLIIAGDCIDRGAKTYEMLKWMERCPPNVLLLRGNHEEEFIKYVELMLMLDRDEELDSDFSSAEDAAILYDSVKYFISSKKLSFLDFDIYGTIKNLLEDHNVTLDDLCRWADIFRKMPYYEKINVNGRTCVAVHAGYSEEPENIGEKFSEIEEFYLYAREEGFRLGGIPHGMIISGHTPTTTIAMNMDACSSGNVFRYYDDKKDCIFYDIDCGRVFRRRFPEAKLACIRLEDEKIFYV